MDPIADTMTGHLPRDATLSGNMHIADALIPIKNSTDRVMVKYVKTDIAATSGGGVRRGGTE